MFNLDNNLQLPHVRIEMVNNKSTTEIPILYWDTGSNTLKVSTDLPDHCGHQAKFQKTELDTSGGLMLRSYAFNKDKPQDLVVASVPNTEGVDDQAVRFQLSVSIQNC